MKVLFAVGNDQLSKNIADKYYEKYGEVLEYKNVFFFKALIEEVKKDKTYNRIVINEEIEEYRASDLEQIDRKIFNYIDQITDEIPGADVIIICGNRRTKSDTFIKKLFSSGIYNFLIGGDRNVGPLCEILRKPKNKREAKEYLGIDSPFSVEGIDGNDSGDVVDEYQIRSILNFYDGIKNQPEKYVETFDRISEQYSRVQLIIIYNWLPPAVKAAIAQVDRYKYLAAPPSALTPKEPPKQVLSKPQTKPSDNKKKGLFGFRKNKATPPSSQDAMNAFNEKGKVDLGGNDSNNVDPAQAEAERQAIAKAQEEAKRQAELAQKARDDAAAKQEAELAAREKVEAEAKQKAYQEEQARLLEQAKKEAMIKEQQANQQAQQDEQARLLEQAKREAAIREQQSQQQSQKDEQAKLLEQAKKEAAIREQQSQQQSQKDEQAKLLEQAKREAAIREQQSQQQAQKDEQAKLLEQAKREAIIREQQNNQVKVETPIDKKQDVEVDKVVQTAKDSNMNIKPNPNAPISNEIEIDVAPIKKEPIKVDSNLQEPKAPVVSPEPPKAPVVEAKPVQPEPQKVPVTQITPPRPMGEPKTVQPVTPPVAPQPSRPASINVSTPGVPTPEQLAEARIVSNPAKPQSAEAIRMKEEQEKLALEQQKIKEAQEKLEEDKRKLREEQERLLNAQKGLNAVENTPAAIPHYTNTTAVQAPQMPNGTFKKMVVFVGANKAGTTFVANAVAHAMASARIMTSILDMTRDKGMWYIYSQQYSAAQQKKMSDYMQRISDGEEIFIETGNSFLKVYSAPGSITDVRRGYKHKNIIDVVRNNSNVVIVDADFTTPIDYFEQASEVYVVQDLDILKMPDTTLFLRELKNRGMNMKKIKVIFNKYVKTAVLNPKKLVQVMSTYSDPAMTYMESDLLPTKVDYSIIPYNINNYTKYTEALCAGLTNYKGYSSDFLEVINEIVGKIYQDGSSTRMPQMNQPKGMKKFFG